MRAVELSGKLAPVYEKIALEEECDFLNAALAAKAGTSDGLHLDEAGHEQLAIAMTAKVKSILNE